MTMIVQVNFRGNTQVAYDFKTGIDGLKAGDQVVVDTANGFSVARVAKLGGNASKATKWVVMKIDEVHFREIVKRMEAAELDALLE